ncbi:MAG: rod shape-determining protein MreC [Azospira oryzae]|jgi:rod shape-determining protein MreC|nr:MAG: rod shape-determining protein MreC [Azospira oryzae]
MERLLNFVYQRRAFFTFLLLELFCAWMVVENNQYQSTKFFNSSNQLAANIIGFSHGVREYFSLRRINDELAAENALLRGKLEQRNQSLYALEVMKIKDIPVSNGYDYVSAKVVNNSVSLFKNYITINKGKNVGLEPGMAVISPAGAIGKVKSVSEHYAVLISLLNVDEQVSSVIKRTQHFGTVQWEGSDPRVVGLKYIPRHVTPAVGDTVVTSGYNAVFPEGVFVGVIKEVNLKEEALFWNIKVELAQDFSKLAFVHVVRSNRKHEKDSLELKTIGEPK